MNTTAVTRKDKARYIDNIVAAHPTYRPDSVLSALSAKRLEVLSLDTLFWLHEYTRKQQEA